jgi:integrase
MATIRKLRDRWQAQVRRRGVAPRAKSFDQKSDAEKWARSLESELDRCGMLPDTRVAESTTLRSILERYMVEVSPRKRSAHTEISRIKALVRRPIAHRTLALLSSSDLATYRDDRLKAVSPSTVIRELNTISHAIDTALKDWNIYLHRNPCKLVRRPSPPRGRNRRLNDDEEQRLLDAAGTGRNIYMRDMIVLAVETGMRRGELLSLDWQHVDLDLGTAHLPMTKNGETRDVPLSSRARAVLQRLWEDQGSPSAGRALPSM